MLEQCYPAPSSRNGVDPAPPPHAPSISLASMSLASQPDQILSSIYPSNAFIDAHPLPSTSTRPARPTYCQKTADTLPMQIYFVSDQSSKLDPEGKPFENKERTEDLKERKLGSHSDSHFIGEVAAKRSLAMSGPRLSDLSVLHGSDTEFINRPPVLKHAQEDPIATHDRVVARMAAG
ncbi:unnamed protein product, partial [Protopolystoma xenopodis]